MRNLLQSKSKAARIISAIGMVCGATVIIISVKFGIEFFLFVKDIMEILNDFFL